MNESYELATATLSCLGDGVISTDLTGKIIYMNHIAEEILELNENESIGKEFDDVIKFYIADTKKRLEIHLYNVIKNDKISGLKNNTIIITKSGIQKYVSATISAVKDNDNAAIGVVIILRDITRLKKLEINHVHEKWNFKAIFDSAPVGMVTLDEKSLITEINDACLLLIHKDRSQVTGKNFGYSFSCVESIRYGCGYGPNCLYCDIRKAIITSIHSGKATSNFETCKTLSINQEDRVCWFRASVAPIVVNEVRNSLITLIDITESKNREQYITESRDYCNNILNQLPSLVGKTDKTLTYNYVNKVWKEFTGLNFNEMEEYSWDNIIHPDDLERYITLRNETMQKQEAFQCEARIRRHDNVYRWCLIIDAPYYDLEGNFEGYLGSLYDITEKKEAEEDLKRYRRIIDNARDAIFLFDLDGKIIDANFSASQMYGYTKEEFLSLSVYNIRESGIFTKEQMDAAYHTGLFFETVHKHKDGSTFEVEISTQGVYLGERPIMFSIIRDITERKNAERDIQVNQEKYYSLFMNMKSAYAYYKFVYNKEHNPIDLIFEEGNKAYEEMFGVEKDSIYGMRYTDIFPESNSILSELIQKYAGNLINGESVSISELYSTNFNKWLSLSIFCLFGDDVVTIITDITQQKKSELRLKSTMEAAEAANKAKSEFLANMSHEIRTPINGMVGMIDLTLLTHLSSIQRDNLLTAKECANSLLNIINDILDFSKMEAGKMVIENVSFDIRKLIEEIVKVYSPRVVEKGLDLNYFFNASIPQYIVGDSNRIRQVINNLLSNAIKFTNEGEILISIKNMKRTQKEVEIKFSVKDTGIGIAQGDMNHLFQSFSQIEQSFTKRYGGTGLGLAISKNLVELMGGHIGVTSQFGYGSEFFFVLTFKIGEAVRTINNDSVNIVIPMKHLNILLAEDDSINQKVISKMLEEKGHNVDIANNGNEALHLYQQKPFDLILMDIRMPEMNGLEATQKIRELESEGTHIPIIALTAYALKGDSERFLNQGMDGYISKPIDMNNLFYQIEKATAVSDKSQLPIPDSVSLTENGDILFTKKTIQPSENNTSQLITELFHQVYKMNQALQNDDLMKMETIAHDIKNLSSEFDSIEMKDIAFKIELAARRGNLEAAKDNIKRMKSEFQILSNKVL
jgi:PAS domain S-box